MFKDINLIAIKPFYIVHTLFVVKEAMNMKRRLTVILALFVLVTMLFSMVGCSQEPVDEPTEKPAEEPAEEPLKVGLLMDGPISDAGWNASAYEGLLLIEENYGAEIAFVESLPLSSIEETFRSLASQGFDILVGHGFQFGDAAKVVGEEFPNTFFVVTSTDISQSPNVASVNIDNEQQGFLMGCAAALLTESNIVGSIGGMDIPPIRFGIEGFAKGVDYINPEVKILAAFTGSFDDSVKMKEVSTSMADAGADVIMANAGQAGLGSIDACMENGILAIGSNTDQNSVAPDTVAISVIKNISVAMDYVVQEYKKGTIDGKFYNVGVSGGAVYLSPWHGFADKVPAEIQQQLADIQEMIASGELEVSVLAKQAVDEM
jgi:basic membrane protein A